jgi:DNA-binding beta-propeller fold protein YncE
VKIQDVKNTLLQFLEGDAPATPEFNIIRIYAKPDGKLYSKNDAGTETPLGAASQTKAISFYIDDALEVGTGLISVISPQALTITEIRLAVDTAPTGAALIIDINKNGTTIYTTQNNRPIIAIDGTSATATDPDITSLSLGDKISIDIDQIGSTAAGENLSVIIICEV